MGLFNKFRKESQKLGLEKEVATHLMAIFNTKRSFGAWQKGLGLQNYSSSKSRKEVISEIADDIKYNIDCFEKRIKVLEIQLIDDKSIFNVRFQIKCQLGGRFHSFYVGFKQSQNPLQLEVKSEP